VQASCLLGRRQRGRPTLEHVEGAEDVIHESVDIFDAFVRVSGVYTSRLVFPDS
jgi:hypothetical protein